MKEKKTRIIIIIFCIVLSILMVILASLAKKETNTELKDIESKLIKVKNAKVLPENEGKLVLVSGNTEKEKIVTDEEFNISVQTIKLVRKVEMYQWRETKTWDSEKEEYKYEYSKIWSDSLLEDIHFEYRNAFLSESHINPDTMPYKNQSFYNTVKLGEFELSSDQLEGIDTTGTYEELSEETAQNMRNDNRWKILYNR